MDPPSVGPVNFKKQKLDVLLTPTILLAFCPHISTAAIFLTPLTDFSNRKITVNNTK